MKCEFCKKEPAKNVLVIARIGRFEVGNKCLNLYANEEYDKISILGID